MPSESCDTFPTSRASGQGTAGPRSPRSHPTSEARGNLGNLSRPNGFFRPRPATIYVDGSIGAGKSTLLENVRRELGVELCSIRPEPVKEWESVLQKFYRDRERYAFPLQMKVLRSFVSYELEERKTGLAFPINLVERSPATCRFVFGSMLAEEGLLGYEEAKIFADYYDMFFDYKMGFGIFVYTEPDTCIRRKAARDRVDDRDIDNSYMCSLHAKYSEFVKIENMWNLRSSGISWARSPHFEKIVAVDGSRPADEVARLAIKAVNMMLGPRD